MKKIIFITVALSLLIAPTVMAADHVGRIGLGFVHWDAPVGFRYWFSEKMAVDIGVGFSSEDIGDESLTNFTVLGALPINVKDVSERVRFNFMPVVQFSSFGNPGDESSDTEIAILGALEFEVNVTPDFTVSASHGAGVAIYSPGAEGADSFTDFGTFGYNVTEFGFHYYLPK